MLVREPVRLAGNWVTCLGLKIKTGSLASEFQSQRNCLHFIHQTRMYYAVFLPEKEWTRQSVEVRTDALLACGARRFALRVSAGAEAGGLTRRVDLGGQRP